MKKEDIVEIIINEAKAYAKEREKDLEEINSELSLLEPVIEQMEQEADKLENTCHEFIAKNKT